MYEDTGLIALIEEDSCTEEEELVLVVTQLAISRCLKPFVMIQLHESWVLYKLKMINVDRSVCKCESLSGNIS